MAVGHTDYEIQVLRDERWVTTAIVGKEDDARGSAKKLFADKTCPGVRVISNWHRSDGGIVEKEIYAERRTIKDDAPPRVAAIDDAPPACATIADYYGAQSRSSVNRLLRSYLEKAVITPTELMHSHRELKRLQGADALFPSAVDRIATLQAKAADADARARRDEIFKHVDTMAARARKADTADLPRLGDGGFGTVVRKVGAGEDGDFLSLVVLARELLQARNWLAKLERLTKLALADDDRHAIALLDGVIADVLGANVIQELLGWQPGLAAAICHLFDLAEGRMAVDASEAADIAAALNRLFADGRLPESRACLLDRAHRHIKAANPLYRNEPNKETAAFRQLLDRAALPDGFICGPATAEALTLRYARMIEEGGATGRGKAIATLFRMMPDRAYGLIYLGDLAKAALGREHGADIAKQAETVLDARSLHDLVDRRLPPKDKMRRATIAHGAVAPDGSRIADHIDTLLERYLIEEKIVEKLDDRTSSLRDRAIRLVNFCAAAVLPEGKALARARERAKELLRQPNFESHFLEGISDGIVAQKALRDFHTLLGKAGFR